MHRLLLSVLVAFAVACSADLASAPQRPTPAAPSLAVIPPASAYGLKHLFRGVRGETRDVNEKGHMVGYAGQDAFFYELGGTMTILDRLGGPSAVANAVNAYGETGGWVTINWQRPAVWPDPNGPPVVYTSVSGWVWDMNDRAEAVGTFIPPRGGYSPFYWESRTGTWIVLPVPRGVSWAQALGINNDRIIVGVTDLGGVIWQMRNGSFVPRLLGSYVPWAVDHGYTTAGKDGGGPAWGKPGFAASLGPWGNAYGINGYRMITGAINTAGQGVTYAFISDLSGTLTVLPTMSTGSVAYNAMSCGLVVGAHYDWANSIYEPVYWDPGC